MPGRKESLAVPTRDLPCAKGAVGQRRLRDWQRAGGEPPRPGGATAPDHSSQLNHLPSFAIPLDMAAAPRRLNCPILCGQYKKAPWQEILSF